ncbi:MAG: AAA family ATPase, partial [Myxococcales bacterium]|nr:AAA family ATPase [Myxococcales bacterium]
EPGIGKSRLAEALRAAIASDSHTVLHYQCSAHHVNSAFFPVVTQLERAARIARQEAPSTKLNKLAALMAKATPDVGDDLALIGSLLSIPAGGPDSGPQLEPDQRKTRTLAALVRQLEGLVTGTPVLCVFEDVHWIDPSTLELLERLVERVETLPALVLVTCRPEFTAPWAGQPHTTLIALSRLDRRQARAVVEQIGERFPLADDLVTEIVGKTDGIPLFIEELTRAVLDTTRVQHMPAPGNDEPSLSSVGIPSTLQDSLMSRLDRLSVGKPVAQMAAALGREFSRELIATVAEYGDEEIETALEELVRSGLVFRRGAGAGARYIFKHALVQDAAYQSMLRTARRDLHDRIAAVLIEQFPEAVEINPELVAHHDTEAGNLARAASYWRQAGKRAADRAAHVEAIGHYSRGLALLEALDDDTLVASLGMAFNLGLAASMRVLERRDEAFEALDRAESAGETAKDAAGLTDVHYLRGNLFFPQGRIDECLREHERSLDLARRHGLAEKEARALGGMGDAYYLRGRIVTAGRLIDTCVGLCQEHDFRRIRAAYQPMRGLVRFFEMRFDEADEDAKTGAALAAEIGEARPRIVAQQVLSYVLADMARNAEAVAAGEHATALARRLGTPNLEASAKAHMARALYGVGERGAAVELLREAYEMIRASGLAFLGPTVLGYLAWTTSDERERSWALDTGESLLGKDAVSHNYVRFYRFAAETCLEAGQWGEAARYADALEEYTRPE